MKLTNLHFVLQNYHISLQQHQVTMLILSLLENKSTVAQEGANGIPVFLIKRNNSSLVFDKFIPCPAIINGLLDF